MTLLDVLSLWPPFGGDVVPDVRVAVVAILRASADLAAIVGTRIRYGARPASFRDSACVLVNLISDPRGHNLDGYDGTAVARIQVGFYAPTLAECVAAKKAVETALDGFRGFVLGLRVVAKQIDDRPGWDPRQTGADAYQPSITVDYSVKHRPAP